jgi:hypothetical protein
MLDQVNFHEHPALANLGTGDFSRPCFVLQGDRMNLEEAGSFLQGKCFH